MFREFLVFLNEGKSSGFDDPMSWSEDFYNSDPDQVDDNISWKAYTDEELKVEPLQVRNAAKKVPFFLMAVPLRKSKSKSNCLCHL